MRGREQVLPFFWGLSLRTGRATQDEGVTGDDGCRWGSVVRAGVVEQTHILQPRWGQKIGKKEGKETYGFEDGHDCML